MMKNLKYLVSFSFIIIASLTSFSSFALGQLGHQVVCDLAYEQLSADHQQQINHLLSNMPQKHQDRLNNYMKRPQGSPITFAKSCVWADAVRKQKDYKKFEKWHYLNVSRDTKEITKNACKKDCIGQAIGIHQQQLVTETQPWKQAQALMFLGHWLGDIHQPLHISYANDWGGNKIKIAKDSNTRCETLHWYWDDCVLSRQNRSYQQWMQLLGPATSAQKVQPWQSNNPWSWANESYQIVTSPAFKYCKQHNGQCKSPRGNKVTLPKDYQTTFAPVINQRMVLAAKRLANVLSQSL